MYESTNRILHVFRAGWLLIIWLAVIQWQPTLDLAKLSHWNPLQGSTHFDTSKQSLSIIHQAQWLINLVRGRWIVSRWQTLASPPKLESLPPTNDSFRENVAHKYLQVTRWWNAFVTHPIPLDATKYGWSKDEDSGCLTSKFAPFNSLQAPDEMLFKAHQGLLRTAVSTYVHHIDLAVKTAAWYAPCLAHAKGVILAIMTTLFKYSNGMVRIIRDIALSSKNDSVVMSHKKMPWTWQYHCRS